MNKSSKPNGNTWQTQIDETGSFQRKPSAFRHWITSDGPFQPEPGRYHLYVSYACPWAHRTLIVRALKGLQEVISVDVVSPFLDQRGWCFDPTVEGSTPDSVYGKSLLKELYYMANKDYTGTITVPVLWDKKTNTIVNNESSEIIRMLNGSFNALATYPETNLYPPALAKNIDSINEWVYDTINNGVYRCGFAKTQLAYEQAFKQLFSSLDRVNKILEKQAYLIGSQFTEADVRLFTTLIRFDAVYYTHFKCNYKRMIDYPAISRYIKKIYQQPSISATTQLMHIKEHYYQSHKQINPLGIIPEGPEHPLGFIEDR